MKWLSAGLTFFNCATMSALLVGMMAGGLSRPVGKFAILAGLAAAVLAWFQTAEVPLRAARPKSPTLPAEDAGGRRRRRNKRAKETEVIVSPRERYRSIWFWILACCFAIFAFRSFCWLLYYDNNELKVQSPNNLGDLSLHLTYIKQFASGTALWPDNPIHPFSKLRYPAGVDIFNSIFVCLGANLIRGLVWTGLLASVATFYAFYRWSGNFGIAAFLFNGGVASFPVFQHFVFQDYQGVNTIAWKSLPLAMFVTQRGLLYAFPVGLLLLYQWRARFFPEYREPAADPPPATEEGSIAVPRPAPLPFWLELSFYATMPLYHAHTFMTISLVLAFLFVVGDRSGRKHAALLVAAALIPATFCVWITTDNFHASSFIKWQPGWVQNHGDFAMPFLQFWLVNFGAWVPVVLFFLGMIGWAFWKDWSAADFKWPSGSAILVLAVPVLFLAYLIKTGIWHSSNTILLVGGWMFILLLPFVIALVGWWAWKQAKAPGFRIPVTVAFLIPAIVIFLVGYLVKLAPWEWDNIKIIVWAYIIILPFLWTELVARWPVFLRSVICATLFWSGFVTLFGGLAAGKTGFGITDRGILDAVGVAVKKLPVDARYAGWPFWGHPVLLQGRKMVLGYPGHLWTQGFDYGAINDKLQALMNGAPNWKEIARSFNTRYLFWGRDEKTNYATSRRPWERESLVVSSGDWGTIYDLESARPQQPQQSPLPTPTPSH